MLRLILRIILIAIYWGIFSISYGQDISYSQEDRERLIKLETKVEEGYKALNQRINDLREDLRDQRSLLLWCFGILFGAIVGLIAIVIWDRRTAISPVVKRNKELEERVYMIEKILKESAKVEPWLADILESSNFM